MNVRRTYRTLLWLYPNDYTALFAMEMLHAFEQAAEERRRQSGPAFIRFLLGEFIDLLIGAGAEWIAKLTTNSSVRGRCLRDFRMMHPPGVPRALWFAGACLNAGRASLPDEVMAARERIAMLINRTVHAIANHDFPGARRYSHEERQAREELRRLREKYNIDDAESNGCS
jgi:hypothetical protein